MSNLKPNKSTSPSQNLDKKSVRLVKDLLEDHHVEDSQLEEGGTLANIDGYLELLDNEDRIEAKVTVQIKHLTNPPCGLDAFYDIPQSLFGYADRMKGELVLFIACDTDNHIFYWKHIDNRFIELFQTKSNHIQQTMRYHFCDNETCNSSNVDCTLMKWRDLFKQLVDSIKDEKRLAEQFVELHRTPFSKVTKTFTGIENSYIRREEVESVLEWIFTPLQETDSNLCLITGNAGVGKSVIMKDIIDGLDVKGTKSVCIKADAVNFLSNSLKLDQILDSIHFIKSDQHKVVVVIDQIDALSQYLTNDRNNVNIFVSLINTLSSEKDVRVIVSCRKFDLEYDEEIKSICNNSKIIEVGLLPELEVKTVVESIEEDLYERLDDRTKELLKTAQFLDIFCRIYTVNKERCNFSSVTDLYDSYWKYLIMPIGSIKSEEIESLLFDLSNLMLKYETLSPYWTPTNNIQQIADCIASRGVINRYNNQVAFFHQSFYDYVLARSCVSQKFHFVEQVENKFQGFEIRSTIKAVLEYERNHSTEEYANSLRNLLFSKHIRKHVKYLVLSLLAFTDKPLKLERIIIRDFFNKGTSFLPFFLRCIINDSWFVTLRQVVSPLMPNLSIDDDMCYPIANFLSHSSYKYAKDVFLNISDINNQNTRNYFLSIVLRGHNDYRENCTMQAFSSYYDDKNNFMFLATSIQDAITTNKEFALQQTKVTLRAFLDNPKEFDKTRGAYELVEILCEKLAQDYSEDFLMLTNDLFLETVEKKSTPSFIDGLHTNSVFDRHMDDYVLKLYMLYHNAFIVYQFNDKKRQKVIELLNTKDECATCLALEIISMHSLEFSDIIENWFVKTEIFDTYLLADTEYYLLQVLHNWFVNQSKEKQLQYEQFVLNYISKNDLYSDSRRTFGLLYPYLWYNKWKLLCVTIPEELSSSNVNRCRQELIRRFKHSYIAKKPNHKVSMARLCGGVTSKENYMRFTPKQWLHSFLHLKERWVADRTPIDYRVHASMFKECVSLHPYSFTNLIAKIINDSNIKIDYKVAGILGLLEGQIDVETVWPLIRCVVDIEFAQKYCHDFGKIIEYYIHTPNSHINEIAEMLLNIVKSPCEQKNIYTPKISSNELSQQVNEHLTKALNRSQGKAVELLLKMCSIPSKKKFVYTFLNDHQEHLDVDIKVLVLYYIFTEECYDEKLTTEVFVKYITDVGCIGLYINVQTIQHYMYHNPQIIRNYLESIEHNTLTHELLSQIYFYGLSVPSIHCECQTKLEKILDLNHEKVIAEIVRVAMCTYSDSEYHNYSKYYLERYAKDERDAVVHSFCIHCDSLSINDFDFFLEIFQKIKLNKYVDSSDVLDYIKKVVNCYPIECYKFIRNKLLHSSDSHLLHSNILEVLNIIYKRLNDEDDSESLNELMEIFENDLYISTRISL